MMKRFRKMLSMVLVFSMMTAVVTGCGNSSTNSGKYLIATDTTFAPFEYEDNGTMVGIDMDILAAIAQDQDFKYELKTLGFNAAITALEAKQVDGVIAGMSITDERAEKYDFSTAYYEAGVTMAVKNTTTNVKSYDNLKGKTVAVKIGTQGAAFADSIKEQYNFKIKTFEDSSGMYDEVIAGGSIACFEDFPVVSFAIKQGLALQVVGEQERTSSYGFAVNKGKNTELLEKFNKGLENIKANGTYQKILDKYTA